MTYTDNNNNADKNIEGILDPLGTVIYGIWIHDLWDAGVALYQLSQQANWEMNFSKALFSLLLKKSSQLRGLPLYSFLQLQCTYMIFIYLQSCNNADDLHGKVFFYTTNFDNKRWTSKPSTSLKQKLELGIVLQVEIVDIWVVAPLSLDLFVLFSNLRFKSQSDVILAGSLWLISSIICQILSFFSRSF